MTRRADRRTHTPPRRTQPTTGQAAPRDPGPHGKTLEQTRTVSPAALLADLAPSAPRRTHRRLTTPSVHRQ